MATTRRGDFTHKSYLHKVYENGFNSKRRDYIKAEGASYMSWVTDGFNYQVGNATLEYYDGTDGIYHWFYMAGSGDSNIGLDVNLTVASDPTRPAYIKSSDLTLKQSFTDDMTSSVDEYYIQVFDYKVVYDNGAGTVTVYHEDDVLDSDTISSSFDYLRFYEDEDTFYIANSSDGITWTPFASRVIDYDNDLTTGQLIVNADLSAAGTDTASVAIDEILWLRHDRGFKGIISDLVLDDLQFTENINASGTTTTIKLKQDPVYTPEYIKNGAFIDIYANYWGYLAFAQSDTILDHDGLPITDENDQPIIGVFSPDLTPEEDSWLRFSGYIDSIEDDYDAKEVTLNLVSHGEELANIIALSGTDEVVDVIAQRQTNATESVTGSYTKRQTFTLDRVQKISGIFLRIQSSSATDYPTVTLGTGTTTVATAQARVSTSMAVTYFWFNDDIELEAGTYWIRITNAGGTITWSYQNADDVYDGGSRQTLSGGVWSDNTDTDAYFGLFLSTIDTTVEYVNADPPLILEDLFDGTELLPETNGLLRRFGSQVTLGQVDDIGYDISLLLKMNTAKEAIDRIYEQMTLGWWWSIDTGTSEFTMQAPTTEPEHVFYVGKDILELKIRRAITNIKNDVFFVGGTINEAQNTLTIRTVDTDSITRYRRGLSILTDGRVFRYDTAQAFSDFEIAQNSDELITTEIQIQAKTYDIETIRVGDLIRIVNLGGTSITLQVASLNYTPLSVTLSLANVPNNLLKNLSDTQRRLDNSLTLEADSAI